VLHENEDLPNEATHSKNADKEETQEIIEPLNELEYARYHWVATDEEMNCQENQEKLEVLANDAESHQPFALSSDQKQSSETCSREATDNSEKLEHLRTVTSERTNKERVASMGQIDCRNDESDGMTFPQKTDHEGVESKQEQKPMGDIRTSISEDDTDEADDETDETYDETDDETDETCHDNTVSAASVRRRRKTMEKTKNGMRSGWDELKEDGKDLKITNRKNSTNKLAMEKLMCAILEPYSNIESPEKNDEESHSDKESVVNQEHYKEMVDSVSLQASSQLPNNMKNYCKDEDTKNPVDFEKLLKEKQVLLYELQREKHEMHDHYELSNVLKHDYVKLKDETTCNLKDAENRGEKRAYERFLEMQVSLEEKCATLEAELLRKDEINNLLQETNTELQYECGNLKAELTKEIASKMEFETKCVRLEADLENKDNRICLLEKTSKDLQMKLDKEEDSRKVQERKSNNFQAKLEREEASKRSLEKKCSNLESNLSKKEKIRHTLEKKNSDLIRNLNRREDDNKSLKNKCNKLQNALDREEDGKKSLEKKYSKMKADLEKDDESRKTLEERCSKLEADLERKEGKELDWCTEDADGRSLSDQSIGSDKNLLEMEKHAFDLEQTKQILNGQTEQIEVLHMNNERLTQEKEEMQRNYELTLLEYQTYRMQCDGTLKKLKNEVINDLNIMVNNIMVGNMATIEGTCVDFVNL